MIDINDKPPQFTEEVYKSGVLVTDNGKVVVHLNAIDPDANSKVTYSYVPDTQNSTSSDGFDDLKSKFELDPNTGDIKMSFPPTSLTGYVLWQVQANDECK